MLHEGQSIHRFFRSVMIIICAASVPVLSTDTSATLRKLPFETFMCGSLRMPVLSAATQWKSYPTAGIYFAIPSTLQGVSCMAGGEAGVISDKSGSLNIQCVHLRFGIVIDDFVKHHSLQLRPEAGISSMMIGGPGGIKDFMQVHVFGEVENEFGIYFGIEPGVTWKKLRFSIPVRIERTFSSPDRFDAVIISGLVGYRFEL